MPKLPITKTQEAKAIARILSMGAQSLDPLSYRHLGQSLSLMAHNRNIEYGLIAAEQVILSGKEDHDAYCHVHCGPAYMPEPCNCKEKLGVNADIKNDRN